MQPTTRIYSNKHSTYHTFRSGLPDASVFSARVLKIRKSTRSVGAGPSAQAADEAAASRAQVGICCL